MIAFRQCSRDALQKEIRQCRSTAVFAGQRVAQVGRLLRRRDQVGFVHIISGGSALVALRGYIAGLDTGVPMIPIIQFHTYLDFVLNSVSVQLRLIMFPKHRISQTQSLC